jgi:hypothetical protein
MTCEYSTDDGLHWVMSGKCINCKLPVPDAEPAMRPIPAAQCWYFGTKDRALSGLRINGLAQQDADK